MAAQLASRGELTHAQRRATVAAGLALDEASQVNHPGYDPEGRPWIPRERQALPAASLGDSQADPRLAGQQIATGNQSRDCRDEARITNLIEPRGSDMAVPEAAGHTELSTTALARLLASGMRDELLTIMREMSERNTLAERLAYSPGEAAELLGISTELTHDLLRTGQLGSVKAGRRRLIGKHHLEAFLSSGQ
jgi:excisionase family DNA binding protein